MFTNILGSLRATTSRTCGLSRSIRNCSSVCRKNALDLTAKSRSLHTLKPSLVLTYSRLRPFIKVPGQRNLFIQTQETPNPNCIKFIPGCEVLPEGTIDFPNIRAAQEAPLAKALFRTPGVVGVFFGTDFVTVTKVDDDSVDWMVVKAEVLATITDFLASGLPIVNEGFELSSNATEIYDDDDDTVQYIKELLDTKIRPTVQEDGGDILYVGFDADSGVLKLKMQGACTGCPSSSVTLKAGVQNMMQFYIPEVKRVEQVEDEEEELSKSVFNEVEMEIQTRPKPT
ncbi:NFU1 iron-sulfur cluster scaffold homolog, mitochondrial-like [Watersipora subatra]|uniref:NFU1 iron-sulfur cluster scaffold homolog, mitochondrial-like n=1 Tax=Watersipora subatra TaxID=2589382 RepID=UPI00355BC69F